MAFLSLHLLVTGFSHYSLPLSLMPSTQNIPFTWLSFSSPVARCTSVWRMQPAPGHTAFSPFRCLRASQPPETGLGRLQNTCEGASSLWNAMRVCTLYKAVCVGWRWGTVWCCCCKEYCLWDPGNNSPGKTHWGYYPGSHIPVPFPSDYLCRLPKPCPGPSEGLPGTAGEAGSTS